jgi:hypothetical protein
VECGERWPGAPVKLRITIKDPDCLFEPVEDAVRDEVERLVGLSDDEKKDLIEDRADALRAKLGRWFEYGEYLLIEIDTDAMTATVVERDG